MKAVVGEALAARVLVAVGGERVESPGGFLVNPLDGDVVLESHAPDLIIIGFDVQHAAFRVAANLDLDRPPSGGYLHNFAVYSPAGHFAYANIIRACLFKNHLAQGLRSLRRTHNRK